MSAFALVLYGPWNHPALAGASPKEGNGNRALNGKGVRGTRDLKEAVGKVPAR